MEKIFLVLFVALTTSIANAQSLKGQWASLQPIEEQPAYLIFEFQEKDSLELGLLFEFEKENIKLKTLITCKGTYTQEEEELTIIYKETTIKEDCELNFPEEYKALLTDEDMSQLEQLKIGLASHIKSKFVQILPMLKALEITNLTDKELKVSTGNFEMTFLKISSEE